MLMHQRKLIKASQAKMQNDQQLKNDLATNKNEIKKICECTDNATVLISVLLSYEFYSYYIILDNRLPLSDRINYFYMPLS